MWLIMVGMDPAEASSRGVLGVVAWKHPESPEEQYDRLVSDVLWTPTADKDQYPQCVTCLLVLLHVQACIVREYC